MTNQISKLLESADRLDRQGHPRDPRLKPVLSVLLRQEAYRLESQEVEQEKVKVAVARA